ncbi:MAG: hypothetical protein OXR73_26705 [Myxococcales bacterium]|nr:hypothetical protein [Myxococcales bacterium]
MLVPSEARWLLAAVLWMACADDEVVTERCAPVGAERACGCADGSSGYSLCLPDGEASECNCEVRRVVPCVAPGVPFACTCRDGTSGTEICLESGEYTPCDCRMVPLPSGSADAGGFDGIAQDGGSRPADPDPGALIAPAQAEPCPAGFSCVDQMGFLVCADGTGVPPLCTTAADCSAAGLQTADCIDPMLGGVRVCAQLCAK